MGYNTNRIKARAGEFEDQYDDAYIEALLQEISDEFGEESYPYTASEEMFDGMDADSIESSVMEEVSAGLTDQEQEDYMEIWYNFSFPEMGDWCFTQVDNELAEIGDQQRDLERDRAWEEDSERR